VALAVDGQKPARVDLHHDGRVGGGVFGLGQRENVGMFCGHGSLLADVERIAGPDSYPARERMKSPKRSPPVSHANPAKVLPEILPVSEVFCTPKFFVV